MKWGRDIVEGYPHRFLSARAPGGQWRSPRLPRKVAGVLGELRPGCVVVYGYQQPAALVSLAWCKVRSVPSLLVSDSELLGRRPLKVRTMKRLVLPAVLRSVDGFLSAGDRNEEYLGHYGVTRSKIFRAPFPTAGEAFVEASRARARHRSAVRGELGIPNDAMVVLFAGKLIPRKRPLDIAGALARLPRHQDGRRVIALLAGDGQQRGELEKAAARLDGALRLVGFADQARLPRLYAASDVYLHPADRDPHPLAVKEAVLSGLPVVTTDRVGSVGPTDEVRPGHNGEVYPAGDVEALAGILETLRRRPRRVAEMASASARIAPEIGVDATVNGFLHALDAVSAR